MMYPAFPHAVTPDEEITLDGLMNCLKILARDGAPFIDARDWLVEIDGGPVTVGSLKVDIDAHKIIITHRED